MELTRTEFELLVALALRPGQVLTRHDLVTEVWDTTWVGDERIVDVHIGNLRRKLGTDTRGRGFIDTVRSRDNGGAGIGLTISKALIEAHGGTLTATSPGPGRGAVFALRLPLSPPDSEEAAR